MSDPRVRVALAGWLAAALVSGCGPEAAAPSPAGSSPTDETPHGPWRTEIPEDFPISRDVHPHGEEFEPRQRPVQGEFCGSEAFGGDTEADVLRDGVVGPEYADARELRLFADDEDAERFLAVAERTASDCPEETRDGTTRVHDVRPLEMGEEAVRIVLTYRGEDDLPLLGATWWDVVRVGNAVLVTATSGEYAADETLGRGLREHEQRVGPVVERMCLFSASGCA